MNRGQAEPELERFAALLVQYGVANRHRLAVFLSGSKDWGLDTARLLTSSYATGGILRIPGDTPASGNTGRIASGTLGREFEAVIMDCHHDFDPDTIGIAGGTVLAGGLMIFLVPPLEDWPMQDSLAWTRILAHGCTPPDSSNYLSRLAHIISTSDHCILVEQDEPLPQFDSKPKAGVSPPDFSDQERAIEMVKRVVHGQRRKPTILLSDRGRGKSAALGLAAKALIDGGTGHIAVTGASRQSVDCVFRHAGENNVETGRIRYFAPDRLVRKKVKAELLLVDEAASIPLPILARLLEIYPRIAFASTVHGYEGTGRGFVLRFRALLDRYARGSRYCELNTPIRWAPGDPLEDFLFQSLLLDAGTAEHDTTRVDPQRAKCTILSATDFSGNEPLLRDVFGLLVQAHYRTRPFDLWHLLDGCNQQVFALFEEGRLAAVALVVTEGGFDRTSDEKIRGNIIRPRGHLLPELVSSQLGIQGAGTLRYARIVRIVVNPALQGQGLGTRLVQEINSSFKERVDIIGTTFGIESQLLGFWLRSGFIPVRVGSTRGLSSGSFAVTHLHPLTASGKELVGTAANRFVSSFLAQLASSLKTLDPKVVPPLLRSAGEHSTSPEVSTDDLEVTSWFAQQNGSMHDSISSLSKFTRDCMIRYESGDVDTSQLCFLTERIFQHKEWKECEYLPEPRGKKHGLRYLRKVVSGLLEQY